MAWPLANTFSQGLCTDCGFEGVLLFGSCLSGFLWLVASVNFSGSAAFEHSLTSAASWTLHVAFFILPCGASSMKTLCY